MSATYADPEEMRNGTGDTASVQPAKENETFTFFWGNKTPLSQWYPSNFTVDGHQYNHAEQYMMQQKAVLFKDWEKADAIMHAQEPGEQQSLGRKVSNFDRNIWHKHCRDIVKKGNMAKFSQNADMKKELLATAGSTLVEASLDEVIWGIGVVHNNPLAHNRSTWQGKNWLGFALTEVRDQLIEEAGEQ